MKRRKKSFLSDSLRTQIKKLYGHLKAILFLFVAYGLWFTLFKYSPNDRSFNVVGADSINHPLGWFGSYSADILHQIYGKLSFLLPLFFIGFAINLWINKKVNFLFRFFIFLIGISMLSFSMAYWFYPSSGSLGYIVFRDITFHFTKIMMLLIVCLTGILSVLLTFYGSCIPFSNESFHTLFKVIHASTVKAFYYTWGAYKFGLPFIKKSITNLYKTIVLRKKELPQTEKDHLQNPFTKDMVNNRFHNDLDTQKPKAQQLDLPYPFEEDVHSEGQPAPLDNSFGHFKEWIRQKEKKPKEQHSSIKRVDTNDSYTLPSVELLTNPKNKPQIIIDQSTLEAAAAQLEEVLSEFGVKGEIVNIRPGPVVTMYELKPAPGIKSARVIGLAEDIARSMCALSARIAVIPGRNVIGIELPNPKRETVYMREMLESSVFEKQQGKINIILGKDIGGAPIVADLAKMPHLLVAGTTGSGKSVAINAMILSILYKFSPDVCKFIMIDPKMLELSVYDDIPHLLTPVVTDPKKAVVALKWAVKEMENRYRAMSKLGVRNIEGYNERLKEAKESGEILTRRVQTGFDPDSGKPLFETQSLDLEPLPFIVVIVDEMADLMLVAGKDIEAAVQRLAQMARAAGIHLIMATQRPSVDVITGTIKANFPTRVSFMVTSKIDSRTILGEQGAEQLLGQGDMLYMAGGGRIQRVHGPFVNDQEVDRIVSHLKSQAEPSYIEAIIEDDEEASTGSEDGEASGGDQLYNQALEVILREGKASTSFVQRHLQIGYNRAARIIEQMEKNGVISAANHAGKREVIGR